jgi:phage shock protein C
MVHRSALYRDTQHGKLTGVCAGLANYFGLEVWLVRIVVISASLLGMGFLMTVAYIALSLMLEKQPEDEVASSAGTRAHKVKNRPWEQGQSPSQVIWTLQQDLESVENRVCRMEAYVTSESFKVNKAFREL